MDIPKSERFFEFLGRAISTSEIAGSKWFMVDSEGKVEEMVFTAPSDVPIVLDVEDRDK